MRVPRGRSKGYANRTDLQSGKALPVSAPTGLPYGDGKALKDAQKAVPMAGTSAPKPPAAAPEVTQPASAMPPVVPLTAPTQRPSEPIMAGVDRGGAPNEVQSLKNNYLSYFEDALRSPEVPEQFKSFVVWLRNQ